MFVFDKKKLYEQLKPFAKNKYQNIFFFFNFGDENQYTLSFDWCQHLPDGKISYKASTQLWDNRKSGANKYITKDLFFDMQKEQITTDFKLFKFLKVWAGTAVEQYECETYKHSESCEDCVFSNFGEKR